MKPAIAPHQTGVEPLGHRKEFVAPMGWWNVPGSAPGPRKVQGRPDAGIHTAGPPDGGSPGVTPAAAGSGGVSPDDVVRWLLMAAVLAGFAYALMGCTVMTGNGTGFTYASLAGNAEGLSITPTGATAGRIDNATGAQLAREAVGDAASAYTWGKAFGAVEELISEGADVMKDNNATDEAINANNNATKKAIKTFVPPEPEVPAP